MKRQILVKLAAPTYHFVHHLWMSNNMCYAINNLKFRFYLIYRTILLNLECITENCHLNSKWMRKVILQGQWLNVCFHYADSNGWCPEFRIIYAFSSEQKCTRMIESGYVVFLFFFFWISSHMRTSVMLWTQCELINFLLLVCQSGFSVIINHQQGYDNSISLSLFIFMLHSYSYWFFFVLDLLSIVSFVDGKWDVEMQCLTMKRYWGNYHFYQCTHWNLTLSKTWDHVDHINRERERERGRTKNWY